MFRLVETTQAEVFIICKSYTKYSHNFVSTERNPYLSVTNRKGCIPLEMYPNVWLLRQHYGGCRNIIIWLSQLPCVSAKYEGLRGKKCNYLFQPYFCNFILFTFVKELPIDSKLSCSSSK